ncbi:PREDICTED: uncharacterized protein LOC104699674 [Camelina sativa]|uniref:Uncharacterized protein LOC104699674 n=1 Tax=Camelina sativa TaxID=90675 RepID=A0ABM0SM91_CAMSA|nr:PREDICTED: uncharacterized protein LOC104699674 [Camelina sativa]
MEEEKPSDKAESSEILGDWDSALPANSEERIVMVSVPTSPRSDDATSNQPKEIESRVSEKEGASTSTAAGRRVLPPWMDPSYEWGGGKWKEDGRKLKKKKKKKEKESDEIIPFKEIIEALLRNSGDNKVEEEEDKEGVNHQNRSCVVDMLKSMGLKFP